MSTIAAVVSLFCYIIAEIMEFKEGMKSEWMRLGIIGVNMFPRGTGFVTSDRTF